MTDSAIRAFVKYSCTVFADGLPCQVKPMVDNYNNPLFGALIFSSPLDARAGIIRRVYSYFEHGGGYGAKARSLDPQNGAGASHD